LAPERSWGLGEFGYPWTEEMVSLATKYENVYIDTSAHTPERHPDELVRFMKGPGQRKVAFGSNFPMIQPAKCIAQLDSLGLSDETRRAFLYENAQRVFRLET
jgi:predicted TIM-barrel fold metal-dependent hydrolase